jgi:hypothetical protein
MIAPVYICCDSRRLLSNLTRCSGLERELELPGVAINTIARLLIVRIYMCEPTYTTLRVVLEISAMCIEEVKVALRV